MKYLKILVFVMLAIIFPKLVIAQDVTVRVLTNPSNYSNYLVELVAEKDVTTVADLKTMLTNENVNVNNYLVLNNWYDVANDNEVICGETFTCNGPENELFTTLYLMEKNHTEKTFTLKSIPATNEMIFSSIVETNYEMFGSLSYMSCNDSFTVCTFIDNMNFIAYDNVKITYKYDKDIQKIAQDAVDKGLLNKTSFVTTDTELLHYINYGGSLADYTTEFKNQVSNLNFRFELDQRGGAFDPFETGAIGFYKFLYGDTIYAIKSFMSITAPHIIYVPTDTTDIKTAIEKRLNDMFGDKLVIEVTESTDTINEVLVDNGEDPIENGNSHYYILTVNNPDSEMDGEEFFFIPVKDSSKINNKVSFKSNDLITNVLVSTDGNVPLDTLVNVDYISTGEEYDKLIKVLDIAEGEVFDIKLYSNAQKRNIKELDNGKFLVSIPIPEKYEGKNLVIYYVDQNNKITEYTVVVKDNYATFETDHFSIYTLALKSNEDVVEEEINNTNTPAATPVANQIEETTKINNPETSDNIMNYMLLVSISVLGLLATKKYYKRNN